MLRRLIRSVRKKSKGTRDNIALGIAVMFTGVVAVTWLYHWPMGAESMSAEVSQTTEKSAFADLFSSFKDQFSELKEESASIKKEAEEKSLASDLAPEPVATGAPSVSYESSMENSSTGTIASQTTTTSGQMESVPQPIRIVTTHKPTSTATTTSTDP